MSNGACAQAASGDLMDMAAWLVEAACQMAGMAEAELAPSSGELVDLRAQFLWMAGRLGEIERRAAGPAVHLHVIQGGRA